MTRPLTAILSIPLCIIILSSQAQSDSNFENEIEELLNTMSLEEKIGQTAQRGTSSRESGLSDEIKEKVRKGQIGSFLNVMNDDYVKELQRIAIEESPNGIPLIFGRDVIHGFKTIFPIPLGQAATWNPSIVEQGSRIASIEASSAGIRWTFAPMLDISRDARWGRIAESPGEDPYLASRLAQAYVKGFQGEDLNSSTSMLACGKHFVGYGAAEAGRDYNTAIISKEQLHNIYLPPFRAAASAGIATYMSSFNEINGVPATGNEYVLKSVLRSEWGFDGFVVSDWNSVTEMIAHGFCEDERQAAQKAAVAGLDMEMTSKAYEHHLKELVEQDIISTDQLDDMVRHILTIKFRMGLFNDASYDPARKSIWYDKSHLDAATQCAEESMVLLENDNILPLSKDKKIGLLGPLADAPLDQLGTWIFDGDQNKSVTPKSAMTKDFDQLTYIPSLTHSRDINSKGFSAILKEAKKQDVIVFVGGEEAILSGEAHSRANINLPGAQEQLIKELSKLDIPIVLVLMAGRPITLENIKGDVDAILMAWHPGTMAGPALSNILSGKACPSGRLPVTWPKTVGQIPIYYNHKNTGRPASEEQYTPMDQIPIGAWQSSLGNTSHHLDAGYLPDYPFGFGLSYSSFDYGDIKISADSLMTGQTLKVTTTVTNTGAVDGYETAQLYIQDRFGSLTRPVRELKGFKKKFIKSGESKEVSFEISEQMLKFFGPKDKWISEAGEFNVWISSNSASGTPVTFELIK